MNARNAFVRAIRTGIQTLAAGLGTIGIAHVSDLRAAGDQVALAFVAAGLAFAISFLQNVAEDSSGAPIPKG